MHNPRQNEPDAKGRPEPLSIDNPRFHEGCDNALRIVTCVNACAGLATPAEALEGARSALEDLVMLTEAKNGVGLSKCPQCWCDWSEREVDVMLKQLSGACMCGKWSFDARKALLSLTPSQERKEV